MTNLDDFDRSLSAFLGEGPTTAPEAPVIAAMAHARTTPRRWDPLAPLRRDVMARRFTIGGLQPGLVLAAAALALAAIGIAVVAGSRKQETVPLPSATPSADASPTPLVRSVQMVTTAGGPLTVTVTDTSGFLLDVTSVAPGDGASVGENDVRIDVDPGADPNAMLVTWMGLPCEATGTVLIDEGDKSIEIARDGCNSGDTFPLDRVLRLQFAGPVQPAAWRGTVGGGVASPAASGPVETASGPAGTAVELHVNGGNPATVDVADASGQLASARSGDVADTEGPEFLTATNVDARTVRVTWPGSPCDTVHRLTIAADFGLTLDRPRCFGDAIARFYALELVFDVDVDADTMDAALREGNIESGLPTDIADGIDAAGNRYALAIFDASGRLQVPEPFSDGTQPPDPGPAGYVVERRDDQTGRLTWRGPACATSQTLRIDAGASDWGLSWQRCAATAEVLRVVDLTFDHLPDTTGIAVKLAPPEP